MPKPKAHKPKTPAKSPVALVPQAHGGALKFGGNPGNKGGTGRPRTAFKKFCRELATSAEFQDALKSAATNANHDDFIGAAKLIATFATSKPAKTVNHNHRHFTDPRAVLADRLARLAERN